MKVFLELALQFSATIYGLHEKNCGDIGKPIPCAKGAVTASGQHFDPDLVTAAIPAPTNRIMRPFYVCILSREGKPVHILVNDKTHPRWIGKRGLDLTPGAWKALGYEPTRSHSAKLEGC